ncbi:MAG: GNAT family N-acetyltransferase [Flammeovirgaceae bacterium]
MIQTERLLLRHWTPNDLPAMIRLNEDQEVMRYFPEQLSPEQSKGLLAIFIRHQEDHQFVYFAAETLDTQEFIGFIGLKWQTYESHFTPCIDIGWRLLPAAWGKGYATEGAKACLAYGFNTLKLKEIYAICPVVNQASEKVMQRLGMTKVDEFNHPAMPEDSPLNPCNLYLIKQEEY